MASINAAQFRAEAEKTNPTLGRIFASSLEPIFAELGRQETVFADADKMARLQELICQIPADRQVKYQAALNVLKEAGLAICGRPCDPSMHFLRFDMGEYRYVGIDGAGTREVILTPGSLHHVFDFRWKSTTGNMRSLMDVATREFVKFRTSQRNPPFNDLMPDDREFYWGESDSANFGFGRDDHMIKPPSLMCRYPWEAGENVAEQWYQYSLDKKTTWHNIPGAAYLLTKGVRQSQARWVFYFRKSNWLPHNTRRYSFEVEYPLDPPLPYQPKPGQKFMRANGEVSEIRKYGRLISAG